MNELLILAAEEGAENGAILPHDINEVIWSSLAFFIVVFLLVWKAGPAIKSAWNGRIERIEGELGDAAEDRSRAEGQLADVQGRIADADAERERILAEARQTAESLRTQLVARAEADAEEMKSRAAGDIEGAKEQVLADLRSEVSALALGAAEAVVAANLDQGTQADLVEAYIRDVQQSGAAS